MKRVKVVMVVVRMMMKRRMKSTKPSRAEQK